MQFIRSRRLPALLAALPLVVGVAGCGDDNPPTQPPPPAPDELAAPENLTASQVAAGIRLNWDAVADATTYDVQRRTGGGAFADIATDLTATQYTDDTAVEGVTYQYQVIAKNDTQTSDPSGIAQFTIGLKQATLSGSITGTRTLSKDTLYIMQGVVLVEAGGTLIIPAGTQIQGDADIQPTALLVRIGGTIRANGTAAEPVVFTSSKPIGSRARGDWGGVVLNGESNCNFPAGQCIGEGASGPYGGNKPNDNSGKLSYVRIEYAGFEVSFGNELNGLTLNGVGAGTQLEFIQAHYGLDDGIEFFGGTVDLKYAIVTGASDDSFDYSTGWQGRGQFWIAQQDPSDADNGFEVDGNEDDPDAMPFTTPTIYNVTLVGGGSASTPGESTRGMLLRRGTGGDIYNAIVMGFATAGLDIDQAETVPRITVQNSIFNNTLDFDTDVDDFDGDGVDDIDESAIALQAVWNNRTVDPQLIAPFDRTNPDFRPAAGSPALTGAATPPNDGFFTVTDYVGGVDPNGAAWYEGWITTDQS